MDNYDEISRLLSLNETEQKKIFTINALNNQQNRARFKEVYIKRGATGEVYGVEVSLFQYLCYTTEKPEKTAVETYLKRYGGFEEALEAFIDDFSLSGLKLEQFVSQLNAQPLS